MKNLILLSAVVLCGLQAKAQTTFSCVEGQPAMVYALPRTELAVQVVTEKITQQPGAFYRYSERYLATKNVITEEKTSYRIKSIKVTQQSVPDPDRTFSFVPTADMNKISVDSKGILCGVNVPANSRLNEQQLTPSVRVEPHTKYNLLPLGEEYMMAGSEAKMAEGAAKQIYRIRESRLSLLTADVEKLPADGASLKSMLDGMNDLERDLTELFVGKNTTEEVTTILTLVPTKALENQILFRFSSLRGLVASDDLSGAPYYITIKPAVIPTQASVSKQKAEKEGLYYVIPASTRVMINDGVATNYAGEFYVPQFGKLLQLPESAFRKSQARVQIDPQTGRLLSVE